jgi:hypothetical protein
MARGGLARLARMARKPVPADLLRFLKLLAGR